MVVTFKYREYDVLLSLEKENIYIKMVDSKYGESFDANVNSAQLELPYDLDTTFKIIRSAFDQHQVKIIPQNHALHVIFDPFHKTATSNMLHFEVTLTYSGTLWKLIDDRFTNLEAVLLQQSSEMKRSMDFLLETTAQQMMQMQTKLATLEQIVHTLKKPDISLPSEFFLYDEYIISTLFKPEDKSIYIKMSDQRQNNYELTFDPTGQHWVRVNSDPECIYKLITETFAKKNKNLSLWMSAHEDVMKLSFHAILGHFSDVHIEFYLELPRII